MFDDPSSTRILTELNRHLIAESKKRPYHPGIISIPTTDTELKTTSVVPRVFVVVKAIMNPDITQPNEISIEGVYVERGNAEKFICEQPYDIWTNWTVESYDVADHDAPTNLLIDAKPEYGAVVIPFDDQDVLRESIDKTAAFGEQGYERE